MHGAGDAAPPRVLTIYFRHQRGGLQKRFYTLIEALLARDVEVHVVSAAPLAVGPHPRLVAHRVPWIGGDPGGMVFWAWFTVAAPLVLLRVALAVKPRALIVFDPYYAAIGRIAARAARMPTILWVRAIPWRARMRLPEGSLRWRIATALDVRALGSAEHVVAITRSMIDELDARVPGVAARAEVLPNALVEPRGGPPDRVAARHSLLAARGWAPDSLVVATAGVLSERKNIALLIDALAHSGEPRVVLSIVGDGPNRDALMARARCAGLESRVAFTGWLENPLGEIAGADLFVMPSVHEGMSNALLEAWGAGVPVLAARTPESAEVLGDDRLLFDPGDAAALGATLARLARDPAALDGLARAAAERSRAFAFDWGDRAVALVRRLARF